MPARKKPVELKPPRAVRSQQAKQHIYDTAIQLLREHGYEYVTVNNICQMAGISVGSFYHYYDSKDALLSGFFSEAFDHFQNTMAEESGDPLESIIQYFCSYCDFCEKQGLDFIRSFYTPYNTSTNMMQNRAEDGTFISPAMNDAVKKLNECVDSGRLMEGTDAVTVANDLSIITKGCIYHWCVSGGSFRIRAMAERQLRCYIKAHEQHHDSIGLHEL